MNCINPNCNNETDALHMSDEGYCEECYENMLDGLLFENPNQEQYT